MHLILDIGNTLVKMAVFHEGHMFAFNKTDKVRIDEVRYFIENYPVPRACMISSVRGDTAEIVDAFKDEFPVYVLDHTTLLPFRNDYTTPESLGNDRLAGVAAAFNRFPGQDVLVIDAGTAITYDMLTADGAYKGGAISPGILMRYRALHTFTGKLPLLGLVEEYALVGDSTENCIHSGILNGILSEVKGFIQEHFTLYPSMQIILTGGDYNYFDKRLKIKTFAVPNLVVEGLNIILDYNLEKQQSI